MTPRLRDLPAAVLTLAMALSRGERREALQLAQFVRGLAIQVAFRFVTGEVLVCEKNKATLLFSRLDAPRAGTARSTVGVLAATGVGVVLFLVSNALLLVPIGALMAVTGAGPVRIGEVALAVAVVRLSWTGFRAAKTYRLERQRQRFLPRVDGQPRWRLDLMGATPPGKGHGAAALKAFVKRSDAAGATVYLVTEPVNRAFYRRGGFRVVDPADKGPFTGMLLMRRIAPAVPVPRAGQEVSQSRPRALLRAGTSGRS